MKNYKVHQKQMRRKPSKSTEQNVASTYMRDFYLKDFSYLSPEVLEKRKLYSQNKASAKLRDDSKSQYYKPTCKVLFRKWLIEVLEGFKHFLYQGSLHGVKYIFEPTFSRKERATWIIIVVVSIAMCAGVIIQLFSKSNSTPFVNVIDSLPTPVWAVPFPSVVLCPHLHIQLSYANVTQLDELHQFFASRICPQMFRDDRCLANRLTAFENKMLQDFIVEGSPKCHDVVKTCYWRGTSKLTKWMSTECCDNFFRPLFTNYGLCFVFNGLPLNGMSNETLPWQKTFSPQSEPMGLQWGLDSGYPKVFPPDPSMVPFRVMASGESNGLGVELFLNTTEHQFACDGSGVGFNLLISSPTDHVYTSTVLRLPMDRMTTVEVYPITYRTDYNLKPLSPGTRQCFFQDERKLLYYDFYTDSNCKFDLLLREAVRVCNCVMFNWPRKSILEPVCSTAQDFRCIDDVKAKVEEKLIYAYFADSEEQRRPTLESLSCHPSCNDVLYSSQVFYSDLIKEPGDASPDWGYTDTGEVTRINIHFYDDMFLGQHRHAQYDDYYFVGAIGGLLSLFLGFSIISVAELVYFVLLRPLHVILKMFCAFIKTSNERLSFKVLEQVNDTQELVQVNDFAKETYEYQYKSQVQERISDLNSWRWVLEDLSKRLTDAASSLKHEHKALRVVIERLKKEINEYSRENSRPGALAPEFDMVEDAIQQEHKFLREQKKTFESIIPLLEKHTANVERTKRRIDDDILKKIEAVSVEEYCARMDVKCIEDKKIGRRKKKISPISRWENRCVALKRAGLNALATAVIVRQQARGSRVQLSIACQTYASRVDAVLRKRLHHNTFKIHELQWQRDEIARDLASLESEQMCTEQSLLANLAHESVVEGRLAERTMRPPGEHVRDGVDRKLRDELASSRIFVKSLRNNLDRITKLQHNLSSNMMKIECCAHDLMRIVRLDQERLQLRLGEEIDTNMTLTPGSLQGFENCVCTSGTSSSNSFEHLQSSPSISQCQMNIYSNSRQCQVDSSLDSKDPIDRCPNRGNYSSLVTITEETEELNDENIDQVPDDDDDDGIDDYPLDY